MKPLHVVGLLLLLLSACGITPPPYQDDPYFEIPVGSTLTLNQPAVIPPGEVGFYLQNGRMVSPNFGIDNYEPSCKFEMRNLVNAPRTVQPDTFIVTRVSRSQEFVEWRNGTDKPGFVLVGLNGGGDGGPFVSIESRILYLGSDREPDVFRLTCSYWDDISFPQPLTLSEMRMALGDVFTLRLPDEPE